MSENTGEVGRGTDKSAQGPSTQALPARGMLEGCWALWGAGSSRPVTAISVNTGREFYTPGGLTRSWYLWGAWGIMGARLCPPNSYVEA